MATVNIDAAILGRSGRDGAGSRAAARGAAPDAGHPYWSAEFHAPTNMLRGEFWAPPLRPFVLPGAADPSIVPLRQDEGSAVLRYVEEVKMYANLEAEKRRVLVEEVLDDAAFWDGQDDRIRKEWPASATRGPWLEALAKLEAAVNTAVIRHGAGGVFVKLSARSPKDAVLRTSRYAEGITAAAAALRVDGAPLTLTDEVRAIKRASWAAMHVHTGRDALTLLLRSDRVYKDILCHELFCARPGAASEFRLDVFVHGWFPRLDPEFEFRGFVKGGVRTALTAYNPWLYNEVIHRQRDRVLQIIEALWGKVDAKIPDGMQDYTIDFAVDPSLNGDVWVVEVNNTLPPMAGSCLFKYSHPIDRKILEEGPFQFRVLEAPWDPHADYAAARREGGGRQTMLLPASPAWLDFARRAGGREAPAEGNPWNVALDATASRTADGGDGDCEIAPAASPPPSDPGLAERLGRFWRGLWG
mmetsp:Transcript_17272/g.51057  ORF Transcript_17272/g.51057 Transcript_17272/m.51057 type:complete len:471 (+) Transcript_17272:220-1632(+)|eukprot:CAMPEP_0182915484 /NCGR_PEP_ID=MMETSP0105_2-20130417/354_1 /TAXON_ID=81532 ORGANISM="Acanthoeca-like sp., Strain 10tr" /NCGR_SAMPLE_ID=MMETSP0105_2 /ASSEMBLY_ACC=CAM_ASM_000205 /LENGTH=470 /DNA_ID=CAMNT_0025052353 /DNA_START=173 /DNA_END=1585 /DNA_ORIENTATION=+